MSDPEADRRSFVRGLTIGAIIGAVVAGSSLWTRRQGRRRADAKPVEPPATTEPVVAPDDGAAR
jgi:hypothetical protein